jgi:hypothetical protein
MRLNVHRDIYQILGYIIQKYVLIILGVQKIYCNSLSHSLIDELYKHMVRSTVQVQIPFLLVSPIAIAPWPIASSVPCSSNW